MGVRVAIGDDGHPIFETITPDGAYRYLLFSSMTVVMVQKDTPGGWQTTYVIRHGICPCLGSQNRGWCKHVEIAQKLTAYARSQLSGASTG